MKDSIILASSSVVRAKMLDCAGVKFKMVNHLVDEDKEKRIILKEKNKLVKLSEILAQKKAVSISNCYKDSIVIGCDQVLIYEGKLFSKPENKSDLINQLSCLQGGKHYLFSSCCVVKKGTKRWVHTDKVTLTMRNLNAEKIETYVEENWEEVKLSVGGYNIESRGIKLFRYIKGDYFSVLGIPLTQLLNFLISINAIE